LWLAVENKVVLVEGWGLDEGSVVGEGVMVVIALVFALIISFYILCIIFDFSIITLFA